MRNESTSHLLRKTIGVHLGIHGCTSSDHGWVNAKLASQHKTAMACVIFVPTMSMLQNKHAQWDQFDKARPHCNVLDEYNTSLLTGYHRIQNTVWHYIIWQSITWQITTVSAINHELLLSASSFDGDVWSLTTICSCKFVWWLRLKYNHDAVLINGMFFAVSVGWELSNDIFIWVTRLSAQSDVCLWFDAQARSALIKRQENSNKMHDSTLVHFSTKINCSLSTCVICRETTCHRAQLQKAQCQN